ncbi:hypothetical protein [Burkholderia ambifaria]|uniref:hypothetical protein n=1 Tax=Burkholderia ambifaria TaxID=152480 RepID=UPI0015895D9C|nr:hypothetical protein [Burkholderia ambifaria]
MSNSGDGLKRNFARLAEGYWKSWYGISEANGLGRQLSSMERTDTIAALGEVLLQLRGWGLDALRMQCCRCPTVDVTPALSWESRQYESVSLVEIGSACFDGVLSQRDACAAIAMYFDSHTPSDIESELTALLLDIKAKGREALRRSCSADCSGGPK